MAELRKTPTTSYIDERNDIPSMGDPEFVDTQVRAMFDEARRILFERESPGAAVPELVAKWTKTFSPANTAFVQCLTPQHLDAFLRKRGMGTNDDPADLEAPVTALIAAMLTRLVDAMNAYHEERIDDAQLKFEIDTAAEDFTYLIRGLDNSAD